MTAQPAEPGPDTGSYELIHLGGQAAVVVRWPTSCGCARWSRLLLPKNSRTPRTPRRCWSGRPGTPAA
jgi:hypothetical protein